jgi:UDPglucose 6-dehydrogenase
LKGEVVRVAVVGQGYVGLTAATCLAEAGHKVIGVESDPIRLAALAVGKAPLYEPGLQGLLGRVVHSGQLRFIRSVEEITGVMDAVVMAVGSPPHPSGGADLRQATAAVREILTMSPLPRLIVTKTTVLPGTSDNWVAADWARELRSRYVHSPEFLNQGRALADWRAPTRIVVGLWNQALVSDLRELYRGMDGRWVVTTPTNAEAIKYASNAFLAMRISFANEIAGWCERTGVDVEDVMHAVSLDPRIGSALLRPGVGYGDSCLQKDIQAFVHHSRTYGHTMPLLEAVQAVNERARLRPLSMLREALGGACPPRPVTAVLGLAFEPNSDDIRAAPSHMLLPELCQVSAEVRVWDPLLPPAEVARLFPGVRHGSSLPMTIERAEVILVLTEYPEVVQADWRSIAALAAPQAVVLDAKNCLDPGLVIGAGLGYWGIGRQPALRQSRSGLDVSDPSYSGAKPTGACRHIASWCRCAACYL